MKSLKIFTSRPLVYDPRWSVARRRLQQAVPDPKARLAKYVSAK